MQLQTRPTVLSGRAVGDDRQLNTVGDGPEVERTREDLAWLTSGLRLGTATIRGLPYKVGLADEPTTD